MQITYRQSGPRDIDECKRFLFEFGQNEWNYLPLSGIEAEFRMVSQGNAKIICANDRSILTGFAISIIGSSCPGYLAKYARVESILFIADVVVNPEYRSNGIATRLLELSIDLAKTLGLETVFIERHEENLASAGMMRNTGFEHVETFHDPAKRTSGSRNSTIMKYEC